MLSLPFLNSLKITTRTTRTRPNKNLLFNKTTLNRLKTAYFVKKREKIQGFTKIINYLFVILVFCCTFAIGKRTESDFKPLLFFGFL